MDKIEKTEHKGMILEYAKRLLEERITIGQMIKGRRDWVMIYRGLTTHLKGMDENLFLQVQTALRDIYLSADLKSLNHWQDRLLLVIYNILEGYLIVDIAKIYGLNKTSIYIFISSDKAKSVFGSELIGRVKEVLRTNQHKRGRLTDRGVKPVQSRDDRMAAGESKRKEVLARMEVVVERAGTLVGGAYSPQCVAEMCEISLDTLDFQLRHILPYIDLELSYLTQMVPYTDQTDDFIIYEKIQRGSIKAFRIV